MRGDGTFNQDRYLIGDYYAAVLDGATAYPPLPEARDGGWYADLLDQAIQHAMTAAKPLADVVREAIADVAAQEGLAPGASPSSTVSITRWSDVSVQCYLLGDSTIVVSAPSGTKALSDQRLSQIATQQRDAYRARLSAGSGYDQRHKQLLAERRLCLDPQRIELPALYVPGGARVHQTKSARVWTHVRHLKCPGTSALEPCIADESANHFAQNDELVG